VDRAAETRRGRTYVALAAVAWSTAGLLQRELSVGVGTQLAGRALFATLGLLAYVALAERRGTLRAFRAIGNGGVAVVALLAISSASFFVALNHAPVANVLFMQALAPIIAAALGTMLGERVSRRTWIAMGVALAGVAIMVGGPGGASALGQLLSFLMSVSFAGVIVLTRHHRDVSMAPATCISQLLVFVLAAPFAGVTHVGTLDVSLLATLGICQIGLGFVFLTIGGRLIPLLEIVLGPLWVWLALSERPGAATFVGGIVVLGAVLVQARMPAPEAVI
jgi:drug/metabolite transporter (DMT)-like permease